MSMSIVAASPGRLPAVPVKVGVGVLTAAAGPVRATSGWEVSTWKVRAALMPVLPPASDWRTRAVHVPSASRGSGAAYVPSPATGAANRNAGDPVAAAPAK